MTHTYNITGMTCSSCITKVRSELLKLGDVTGAEIQLQAPQATISMNRHIATGTLQKAISNAGTKYIISDAGTAIHHTSPAIAGEATSNSYFPIFLIFGYITGISLIIQFSQGYFDLMQWMSHFMAGFFLVFSFFKIMNLQGFAEGYGTYDVIAKKVHAYGFAYPFIELGLGIAYLAGFNPLITNSLTILVMGISTIGVVQSLLKKNPFQCACLGTVIRLPLSKVTLFEDLLMVAMSVMMLILFFVG